jgi:septum site-determining protein MinD
MGQVILVTSGKGGSGKSTLTVNCGVALAESDKKVLLIDADIGLRSLDLMLGVSDIVVYDLNDVLSGRCEPVKAIMNTSINNLQLLPAPQSTVTEDIEGNEMKRLCKGLSHYYDYVIIDSPAGIGQSTITAAMGCDRAIVVATADPVCIRDADKIAVMLTKIGITNIRLVLNRINPALIRKKFIPYLDAAIDGAALQLIGVIPEDEQVTIASFTGKILTSKLHYGNNIIHKGASQAFMNIANRLEGRDIPLMKL